MIIKIMVAKIALLIVTRDCGLWPFWQSATPYSNFKREVTQHSSYRKIIIKRKEYKE